MIGLRGGLAGGLTLLFAPLATAANAQSAPEVAWNLGVVSDYVFRGYSQTDENPGVQGGVDATIGHVYVGAWASNVDFGDSTSAEVDLYAGYRTEAAGFAVDVGVVGYGYIDAPDAADYGYIEVKAAASRAIGPATFGAAVYFSPDFFGADERATYFEANASFTPAPKWTVSAAAGYQELDVNDGYSTWNAGLSYAFTDHVAIDVRYHDTDAVGPLADGRVAAGLKLTF